MDQPREDQPHIAEESDTDVRNGLHGLQLPPLRNTWYIAGWAADFAASLPVGMVIVDERVVLYRGMNGRLAALEDRCAHRWAPLSLGRVEGDDLRCMYHGAKYGADGRCIELPGQAGVPKSFCVRSYPVVEKYRLVWVWMGDPGGADPSVVPDLSMLDEPQWRLYEGSLVYEANYALISDNLLDLTHVNFLHEKTLGRPVPTASARRSGPPVISGSQAKRLDNGVRVEGWYPGSRIVAIPKNVPDGDLWLRTDYVVPGIYISRGGMFAEGTAAKCNGQPPGTGHVPLSDGLAIHAVTPMTNRKTRYFYTQGFRVSDAEKEETDAIWEISKEAFLEDIKMIEAQQENVAFYPGSRVGGIAADRGLVLFRGLMKRLIAEEK